MMQKVKLDLACGSNKVSKSWLGVDIVPGKDIDLVMDLFKTPFTTLNYITPPAPSMDTHHANGNFVGYKFYDDSIDQVFCSHFIEHVPDLMLFMNEVHRICKHGAKLEFIAPYYTHIGAWQDPTHVRAISERSYDYFNELWRIASKLTHYPITANFEVVSMQPNLDGNTAPDGRPWNSLTDGERNHYAKYFMNIIKDLHVVLEVRK